MSLVQNPRVERGKILQNSNGQYFFVCSTCDYEFITLLSFLNHQNMEHDAKECRLIPDALTTTFTKQRKVEDNVKEPRMEPDKLYSSVAIQTDTQHEYKEKGSSDSMEDEAENKTNVVQVLRTAVSQSERRRTILVSPKPKKGTRNVYFGGKTKSSAIIRNPFFRVQTTMEENSGKYICKNCSATFNTMVNLDSHETICMLLPIRFYCNRCNQPFDDENSLQVHLKIAHRS